jgi:glycosyltransferase involved in cell wall biosynthesis
MTASAGKASVVPAHPSLLPALRQGREPDAVGPSRPGDSGDPGEPDGSPVESSSGERENRRTPLKTRVLIIVENSPAPQDTRVWKEATTLKRNGYEVTVLAPRAKKERQKGFEIFEGVHIYRHPRPRDHEGALGYLLEYGTAFLFEFFYAWWIFFRRGFDVIQGCNPPDNIVLVALPFKLFGVKYIFDHHDASLELYLSKFGRKDTWYRVLAALERWTYRFSDALMVTNGSYKELAIRRGGCDPRDVFIVRNGPDLGWFKARAPKPELKYGKRFLVGYVGFMSVQDSVDLLVQAADYLVKVRGRRDIHFTCIGAGPTVPALRQMVDQLGLSDTMNFTGFIPDGDLLDILSTADVCVNPDRPCEMNDISTMIKVMEYMALAKPIVQFDMKEGRVSAGESSLYADGSKGIIDFAEKILWLLDHPEERRRMGEFGKSRVENELAWEFSVPHFLGAYERALGARSGGLDAAAGVQPPIGRNAPP